MVATVSLASARSIRARSASPKSIGDARFPESAQVILSRSEQRFIEQRTLGSRIRVWQGAGQLEKSASAAARPLDGLGH
jgi:hypothetical protein